MADENNSEDISPVVAPVRKRRSRKASESGDVVASVNADDVLIQRIRDGGWRDVLREAGSVKYNKLRLLALK